VTRMYPLVKPPWIKFKGKRYEWMVTVGFERLQSIYGEFLLSCLGCVGMRVVSNDRWISLKRRLINALRA